MIRPTPCRFCPYRRDVPSGVWANEEYLKLRAYDRDTSQQPTEAFGCHETPRLLCAGWAQVHGWELLALRLRSAFARKPIEIPPAKVELFKSGCETTG